MTVPSNRQAIVFDTETTGLIENSAIPLKRQPHIIELTALQINLDAITVGEKPGPGWPEYRDELVASAPMFSSLFYHGKLPEETTGITGITQEMVNLAPPFASKFRDLQHFFFGTTTLVGHNLSFDRDMLSLELRRLDAPCRFPWPPRHICTVEATENMKGFRLGLNDLHEELIGIRFSEHHRSEPDTRATARCFVELVQRGIVRV